MLGNRAVYDFDDCILNRVLAIMKWTCTWQSYKVLRVERVDGYLEFQEVLN